VFCGKCGARQAGAHPPPSSIPSDLTANMSGRTASLLCYIPVVGWVAAIVVLASNRFRTERTVRFHAFQGLYLFVAWLMVDWVVSPVVGFMPGSGDHVLVKLLQLVIFGAWILMLVKVSQHQDYRLPLVGELADRSVSEQS